MEHFSVVQMNDNRQRQHFFLIVLCLAIRKQINHDILHFKLLHVLSPESQCTHLQWTQLYSLDRDPCAQAESKKISSRVDFHLML